MSIVSMLIMVFVVNSLYFKKGGQCSFYCRFPIKSRFIFNLDTKNRVVFDTTDMTDEAQDMEMDFSFSLSKGKAKVVHIDDEGSVETVIECLPETSTDGFVTKTVSLTPGQNRLKLVGYDCEDIDLQILFTE